jgi:hypothetical protein
MEIGGEGQMGARPGSVLLQDIQICLQYMRKKLRDPIDNFFRYIDLLNTNQGTGALFREWLCAPS